MPSRVLYVLLALTAIVAVTSQVTFTIDAVADLQGRYPVAPIRLGDPWPAIAGLNNRAKEAGLKLRDRVTAIDGRPIAGLLQAAERVRGHHPGEFLGVTVVRDGVAREIRVPMPPPDFRPDWYYAAVAWLFMPSLAIGLGLWVAIVRPRDRRAWMMLGILLGLSQLTRPEFLDPLGWGVAGLGPYLLRQIAVALWAISMLLFGVYFPQRWRVDSRFPWAKWLLLAVPAASLVSNAAQALAQALNYPLAATLPQVRLSDSASFFLIAPAISVFFIAISYKYSDPSLGSDDRRRLKLLYAGAAAGLTPLFVLFVFDLTVRRRAPGDADGIVLTLALMALVLLPLAMAYVVVVERAMDVRMVLRQGVQYALASRAIRFVQVLIAAGVIASAVNLGSAAGGPLGFVYIGLGLGVLLGLRRAAEHARNWIDRRFFREAYKAEQILGELSEQVRGILDRDALLETVARKISESLHVEKIAVMLRESGTFRPALATGYPALPDTGIAADSPVLERLQQSREPLAATPDQKLPLDAQLVLPLASRKELLGFIGLGPKKSEEPYSRGDTGLLQAVAVQTGLALENARLSDAIAHEVAQRELLNREIEIAREVQQRLFPQNLPEVPALSYAGHCRPARGVGGDYYDFLALASGRLGLAIGDVSGKGVPAALLMASLQASVRGQSQSEAGHVAELMTNVNRLVCDASPENRYATFFYGQFDAATRRLVYSNGGHNAPILLRGSEILRLETGGPPVGLFRPSRYEQEEIALEPGDMLILYTDGMSEAENPAQDEWGEDALIAAVRGSLALAPVDIIARVMESADSFAAGAPQHDDMTLVIARVL
jgi:sigma-B regulation protein RsbU (phosphoserine phosphatase)